VVVSITEDAAYAIGANKQATVTIADNDTGSGSGGGSNTNSTPGTNAGPEISTTDYTGLRLPKVGDATLHVVSPDLLELQLVTKKEPDPAPLTQWNFVDGNNQFIAPSLSHFSVTVDGVTVPVQAVGFKRRALWAPIAVRDLRVLNCMYLKIGKSVSDSQTVEVKNPSGALWNAATTKFQTTVTSLRYSPAIHVNQEGYVPAFAKKAMIGYFIGSLGEMDVPSSAGFKLVDSASGAEVFQGTLKPRADVGFTYTPTPYQKVYEADFSAFKQSGEYRLVVPGLGASLPFLIDDGIAMDFARTYALGLYHQRCGDENKLPYTRHEHDKCHIAKAEVPLPSGSFPFTWNCVAGKTVDSKDNPRHTAVPMTSEGTQLYPIMNRGTLDVSGGHHDAGDYSKYTINSAGLTHYLMFAVDSLPGVAALDNLGLPNSGDGISDVLQEAKWEADYLAKIQDADGGFYFLVYPKEREYEWGVTPDHGDPQVVWPKNTAVTAAAVAALAQTASSPKFKQLYPAESAKYLEKAKLGWQFLMNAIAKYGKDGAYQKITHYGNEFMHDDELAWAACEMFLATGDEQYHSKLKEWFNPSDPATFRWGWWRLYEAWGAATRSYAFAARSGRLPLSKLDAAYLAKCEEQVVLCAQDQVARSKQSAYGTSFPLESKAVKAAGWFFSSERAFDISVGYQIQPKPEFIDGIVANMNYEGGCNPVNVAFVSGLGWKRQRDVVHQFALADERSMPPSGIPIGGFTTTSQYSEVYKGELRAMDYPDDEGGTAPYPMYDRWSDSWNVVGEFVHLDQARSLASLAFLATLTPAKDKAWKSATARIITPEKLEIGKPNTVSVQVEGKDLNGARIVWEARDSEPGFGREFVVTPKSSGDYWIEAEIQWPDGTRAFARQSTAADGSLVVWVDDEVPAGATASSSGGDTWKWGNSPAPQAGDLAHESSAAAGMHQHWFTGASSTLKINAGDKLFAYVYLDPANPPAEIMLQWDVGNWEHRVYWGANQISLGSDKTASRYYAGALPAAGQWVKLEVPASAVGMEGQTVRGMAFTLFNGRAWWDSAGRSAQ
ncbi:MAG TPA: glycoside hydrolase family 9 protein, partial [Verrucomicrobiae bacterium]|nr:glycoside hydrolase family 9 protein [Verrucomicrobiae bacterium]